MPEITSPQPPDTDLNSQTLPHTPHPPSPTPQPTLFCFKGTWPARRPPPPPSALLRCPVAGCCRRLALLKGSSGLGYVVAGSGIQVLGRFTYYPRWPRQKTRIGVASGFRAFQDSTARGHDEHSTNHMGRAFLAAHHLRLQALYAHGCKSYRFESCSSQVCRPRL